MAIAWSTIALVILLLPGFFFFFSLRFPEKFTRETTVQGPLAQLAGSVVIAFCIHAILYLLITQIPPLPTPRLEYLFALLQLEGAQAIPLEQLASTIHKNRWAVFLYIVIASVLGGLAGWGVGWLIVKGKWRVLAQHRWVFRLPLERKNVRTLAYVVTNIREGKRILMYKGFVDHFGLAPDGHFTYFILSHYTKGYMLLESGGPVTGEWRAVDAGGDVEPRRYLAIKGDEIANVVLDWDLSVELPAQKQQKVIDERLSALLKELARRRATREGKAARGTSG